MAQELNEKTVKKLKKEMKLVLEYWFGSCQEAGEYPDDDASELAQSHAGNLLDILTSDENLQKLLDEYEKDGHFNDDIG